MLRSAVPWRSAGPASPAPSTIGCLALLRAVDGGVIDFAGRIALPAPRSPTPRTRVPTLAGRLVRLRPLHVRLWRRWRVDGTSLHITDDVCGVRREG